MIRALFECDSNNRVILRELTETKGKMASQDVNIADGKIEVVTRWQTKYIDRIREVHDTATVVQVQEVVKTVKHVPQFFWWCFGIALVAVGWIARKIIKLF